MSTVRPLVGSSRGDRVGRLAEDLVWFAARQAVACTFPLLFFGILAVTRVVEVPGIARYDLILLLAVAVQLGLVATGFETWSDVRVALRFHVLGLALELFKTHPSIGSWSYPEAAVTKVAGVPLYSGFMYAAVASYVIAAWRLLRLRFRASPSPLAARTLAGVIYLNFFTHHWLPDLRWLLLGATLVVFGRTRVEFRPRSTWRQMPMPLAFLLIGWFIWLAENLSTFLGAWTYPDQALTWQTVHLGKITSWSLLVIVTIVIAGEVMRVRHGLEQAPPRRVRGPG